VRRLTQTTLLAALVGAAVVCSHAAASVPGPRGPLVRRELTEAVDSPCDRPVAGPLTYHWPVKPFDEQHPVRGFFGDPRTVGPGRLGMDRPGSRGSYTFHNGIDISAAGGTPVYPVVSGIAHVASGDRVNVTTGEGRTFQYFHIQPEVSSGQPVYVDRTVLGFVKARFEHVHLTEIDNFRPHNPLDPGHLEPYVDHTIPAIDRLRFTTDEGRPVNPLELHGDVQIAADAEDTTPIPVPGHWFDFPVAPALVTWRLSTVAGRPIGRGTAADFRHTEPLPRDFWHVYTSGTYQNFPDFGHHFYWHVPGVYLFTLTPRSLDTKLLPNGRYRITVGVADTCNNRSTLTEQITIENGAARRKL
jgi:hypothetical protein